MNTIDDIYGRNEPVKRFEVRDRAWYARQNAMKKRATAVTTTQERLATQERPATKERLATPERHDIDDIPDIPYDGWKIFTGAPGHALLHRVTQAVLTFEGVKKYERTKDKKTYAALIRSVTANLAYLVLLRATGGAGIRVSRSKRVLSVEDRYKAHFVGKRLIKLLDTLDSIDLIIQHVPEGRGQVKKPFSKTRRFGNQTVIYPSGRLVAWMADCMVKSLHDVEHRVTEESGDEEIVLLKAKRVSDGNPVAVDPAALVQYKDNETSNGYRALVRQFNAWFAQMDVKVIDPDKPSTTLGRLIDTRNCRLQRVFTRERWDSCGRYFRGWWMELSKGERLDRIRINGRRVVELDFSNMMVRLAYGKLKAQPPEGDQYAIPGYGRSRDAMKIIFSALLFDQADYNRKKLPMDAVKAFHPEELKSAAEVIADIKEYHAHIAAAFGSGMGHDLFFDESQILTVILDTVQKRGLCALPVHDALIVPEDQVPVVKDIMENVFEQRMGLKGIVKMVE